MKKHFWGFALFSFIVGATVFIYAMLIRHVEEVRFDLFRRIPDQILLEMSGIRRADPVRRCQQSFIQFNTKALRWIGSTSNSIRRLPNFFIKGETGPDSNSTLFGCRNRTAQ